MGACVHKHPLSGVQFSCDGEGAGAVCVCQLWAYNAPLGGALPRMRRVEHPQGRVGRRRATVAQARQWANDGEVLRHAREAISMALAREEPSN